MGLCLMELIVGPLKDIVCLLRWLWSWLWLTVTINHDHIMLTLGVVKRHVESILARRKKKEELNASSTFSLNLDLKLPSEATRAWATHCTVDIIGSVEIGSYYIRGWLWWWSTVLMHFAWKNIIERKKKCQPQPILSAKQPSKCLLIPWTRSETSGDGVDDMATQWIMLRGGFPMHGSSKSATSTNFRRQCAQISGLLVTNDTLKQST